MEDKLGERDAEVKAEKGACEEYEFVIMRLMECREVSGTIQFAINSHKGH